MSKLTDADDEQFEMQHWIGTAIDCEYVDREKAKPFIASCEEIGRLLGSMMDKADLFCGDEYRVSRESSVEYFVSSTDNTEH